MCIINISLFISNITITKSFLLTILTYLIINRALLIIYNFYMSILLLNNMSILVNLRKNISKTILTLISVIKNVS